MKVIDLKLPKKSKAEINKEATMPAVAYEGDEYPYGMRLSFHKEEMDKMPHLKKMEVGDKVTIQGIGEVTSMDAHSRRSGKKEYSLEVQVQSVGCEKKGKAKTESMGEAMRRHQEESRI